MTKVILEEGGHHVHLTHPESVVKHVVEFTELPLKESNVHTVEYESSKDEDKQMGVEVEHASNYSLSEHQTSSSSPSATSSSSSQPSKPLSSISRSAVFLKAKL
eukprot:TRINITY_DN5307_c0_g1_i1.p3 TRINITY_DN5307_c0_g1~~TRINITY_DN5307_c0_g1_i1.p3  ORF type:complete len:104 (+),score=35.74 TRINITY_DN5307_c0_g1_i1:121-432(+)